MVGMAESGTNTRRVNLLLRNITFKSAWSFSLLFIILRHPVYFTGCVDPDNNDYITYSTVGSRPDSFYSSPVRLMAAVLDSTVK